MPVCSCSPIPGPAGTGTCSLSRAPHPRGWQARPLPCSHHLHSSFQRFLVLRSLLSISPYNPWGGVSRRPTQGTRTCLAGRTLAASPGADPQLTSSQVPPASCPPAPEPHPALLCHHLDRQSPLGRASPPASSPDSSSSSLELLLHVRLGVACLGNASGHLLATEGAPIPGCLQSPCQPVVGAGLPDAEPEARVVGIPFTPSRCPTSPAQSQL